MQTVSHIITTHKELVKLIECCKYTGYCCYDFETNAQPIYNTSFKPTILSITYMPGFGCSIPLDHPETKQVCGDKWDWLKELKYFGSKVICNPNITKVAQNAKFDNQIWEKYGIYYRGVLLDTMLAHYVLDENSLHGLKELVRKYLPEYGNYEKQNAFDKIPWDKKPLKPLCTYGCQDTDYTFRLMLFFEKKLMDKGLYPLYRNMIMTASRVLTQVEKNGLYLDRKFNEELLSTYKPKIDNARETCLSLKRVVKFSKSYNEERISKYISDIEEELSNLDENNPKDKRKITSRQNKISNIMAGIFTTKKEQELIRPVNLGSNKDLIQLMYTSEVGFKFPIIKYTKDKNGNLTDKPSTDEETLENLRLKIENPDSPKAIFLDRLLELRGLEKMYKTYILGWSEKVQDDNCIHGRLNITGTESGRLSCIHKDTLILTNKGEISIEDIGENLEYFSRKGLFVMTQEGWQPLEKFIYKGKGEMYEVELEDGTTIKCTLDHKFITNKGTRKLREIFNKDRSTIDNKIKLLKYVGQ